jgi:hypothetical protein
MAEPKVPFWFPETAKSKIDPNQYRLHRRLLVLLMEDVPVQSEAWELMNEAYWILAGKGQFRPCGAKV